jgi:hypothetical protein
MYARVLCARLHALSNLHCEHAKARHFQACIAERLFQACIASSPRQDSCTKDSCTKKEITDSCIVTTASSGQYKEVVGKFGISGAKQKLDLRSHVRIRGDC